MIRLLELATLASLPVFLLLDLVLRRRAPRPLAGWRARAFVVTAFAFALSMGVSLAWASLLDGVHLFDLSGLGTAGGAVVGILVYELVHYGYHRAAHSWNWLWRAAHQMHHSAEELDVFGAYYLHPLDTILFTTWASLVSFPLLGLSPGAGVLVSAFLTFNAIFQHAPVRTPRWLGWIVQRPESHSLHHARGVHRHNYSDLPLWDLVFGTFRNPAEPAPELGFWDGASRRVGAMLIGRDVSLPVPASAPVSAPAPASSAARPAA